jgi:hypothetical protein
MWESYAYAAAVFSGHHCSPLGFVLSELLLAVGSVASRSCAYMYLGRDLPFYISLLGFACGFAHVCCSKFVQFWSLDSNHLCLRLFGTRCPGHAQQCWALSPPAYITITVHALGGRSSAVLLFCAKVVQPVCRVCARHTGAPCFACAVSMHSVLSQDRGRHATE